MQSRVLTWTVGDPPFHWLKSNGHAESPVFLR